MRLRLPILASLNLLLLATPAANAQTADDFFNGGAQFYISNNIPAALEKTESGLKLYPNDEKLQKLEKLLKQRQQSQQNQKQNQSQQQQSQQQKNQQQQNQANQNQNSRQQQNAQQQQSQSAREKSGEEKEQGNAMSPQEAKQLLDAQKGDEQVLQLKPKGSPQNFNRPFKDW
jgi:Ca-activated chloride channel family protein